jgi:hypothetical protein
VLTKTDFGFKHALFTFSNANTSRFPEGDANGKKYPKNKTRTSNQKDSMKTNVPEQPKLLNSPELGSFAGTSYGMPRCCQF